MSERREYWKRVIEDAQAQLIEMRAERDEREAELQELNVEIMQLEQLLSSLAPFTAEIPSDDTIRVQGVVDLELADAIREVLKQSGQYRTPRGVRDSLRVSGYDLGQHPNPLASIHGVLKRLHASGEVEQLDASGKIYYRWRGNVTVTPRTAELNLKTLPPEMRIEPKKEKRYNVQKKD